MKAILLAGGKGTRLRPLTVHTPKPIVPIFNRPFLHYQIDLLRQVPEIDEAILSLNYQPRRIEEVFGDGEGLGIKLRYVVEPIPLGTAGAVRYAGDSLTDSVVVFNGDVLTQVDLGAVLRLHRERKARATIVVGLRPKLLNGGMKKYHAASVDSVAQRIPGPRPPRNAVTRTAGKKVRKGNPSGSPSPTATRRPRAAAKSATAST